MRTPKLLATAAAITFFASALQGAEEKKVTFADHVYPILENQCVNCHNPDEAKGGLDLSTYSAAMNGGSGGQVVVSEDPAGSRLFTLMAHKEEPFMPPKKPQASTKEMEIISDWISGGLLETKDSKAKKTDKPKLNLEITSTGKPEGPPPMPEHLLLQPEVITERPASVPALAHSPWAPILAVAGQKQVLLFHSRDFDLLGVLPYPEGFPQTLSFSTNGAYLACGGGRGGKAGNVVAWDIKTGERVIEVGREFDIVLGADISPDLKNVVMGGPGRNIKIWDTVAGEQLHSIKKHPDWLLTAAYSPDGVIFATGGRNGGLYVWEAATGYEFYTLKGHTGAVTDVAWRADGNVLASCSEDGQVILWEMTEGKQVKKWRAHSGGALAVAFAPNGNIASVGRDKKVAIWKGDGTAIRSINASNDIVMSVAFSDDSKRVFSGDWTGTIKVWDVDTGQELASIAPNPPSIDEQLAYSQKRITDLTGNLPKLEQSIQQVSQELASAKAKFEEAKKANADATQKHNAAKGNIAKLEAQVKTLAEQQKAAQEEVNKQNGAVAAHTKSLGEANQAIQTHQAAVTKWTGELQKREATFKQAAAVLNQAKGTPVPALTEDEKKALAAVTAERKAADEAKKAADGAVAAKAKAQQDLTNQLNAAKQAQAAAAKQLADAQAVFQEAKKKADATYAVYKQAEARVAEASKDGAKPAPELIAARDKAKKEGEAASILQGEASKRVVALVKPADEAKAKVAQLEGALTKANQELAAAQNDQKAKTTTLAQADAKLKPLTDKDAAMKAAADKRNQDIAAKTNAYAAAEKDRNNHKAQLDQANKLLAEAKGKADASQKALAAAQATAKTTNETLAARNKALADANSQLAAARVEGKKLEGLAANTAKAQEAAQNAVNAIAKKDSDAKKSVEVAKADLENSKFLVQKWKAAAINLTAHEESQELDEMTTELDDMMEDEESAKVEKQKASKARESAEKTLEVAKKTVDEGTKKLATTSSTVLERALQLVSSRAIAELKEGAISDEPEEPELAQADVPTEATQLSSEEGDDLTPSPADMKKADPEEEQVSKVVVETLAEKDPNEINAEIEALRKRLSDLEGFLVQSYSEADKTKETVVKATEVARKTPAVIAERSKAEQEAAKQLADAEAERKRQEQALQDQKKRIEELRKQYLSTLPKREE